MAARSRLPEPASDEIAQLLAAGPRVIYTFLYDRRDNPPTMVEIEEHCRQVCGMSRSQIGRRVRDLYPLFEIVKIGPVSRPCYKLIGRRKQRPSRDAVTGISQRLRAKILEPQRCARCGSTPLEDGVKLVVDHRLPKAWGGTDAEENLQPLCEECNQGKKDHLGAFNTYSDKIKMAANFDEPQRRLGELLLAFPRDEWIESELLGVVANTRSYQEDWQRRLRDLRFLGWDYEIMKKKERGRIRSYYRLTKSAPWPTDIRQTLQLEAAARGRKRR